MILFIHEVGGLFGGGRCSCHFLGGLGGADDQRSNIVTRLLEEGGKGPSSYQSPLPPLTSCMDPGTLQHCW